MAPTAEGMVWDAGRTEGGDSGEAHTAVWMEMRAVLD